MGSTGAGAHPGCNETDYCRVGGKCNGSGALRNSRSLQQQVWHFGQEHAHDRWAGGGEAEEEGGAGWGAGGQGGQGAEEELQERCGR
jgi:hypothetical protein